MGLEMFVTDKVRCLNGPRLMASSLAIAHPNHVLFDFTRRVDS